MRRTSSGMGSRLGNFMRYKVRSAECGVRSVRGGIPGHAASHANSAFRTPHSALESPTQHRSPVDVQDLARDVAREVGAEKYNRARDLLRGGDPPQRDALLDLPLPPSPFPAERFFTHLRIPPPRGDPVHRDPGHELAGGALLEGDS